MSANEMHTARSQDTRQNPNLYNNKPYKGQIEIKNITKTAPQKQLKVRDTVTPVTTQPKHK